MADFHDELARVSQASAELYRRTRRLRFLLGLAAWPFLIIVWALSLTVMVLIFGDALDGALAGILSLVPACALGLAWQRLTREYPKVRAEKKWFADMEREYGVTREELLSVSLGLEEHPWGDHEGGMPGGGF